MKVALIGYGYWGPNVARNIYKNKNLRFAYICEKRPERLEMARQLYASEIAYTDSFDEVIADDTVDAVFLAVETSAHYALGRRVIEAGKHLYVEKPFTDNVRQAEELKELAEQRRVKIHVDHIMVYHPAIRKIREIVASGELGDLIFMDCSRMNLGQVKNDVSCMWDLSVHDLSIIDYLSDGAEVKTVKAIGKRMYSQKESISFMFADYGSFIANITASWLSPIKERRLIVGGARKMLVYDDVDALNKLIVYDKGFDIIQAGGPMEYDEFVVKTRIGDAVIPKLEQGDALFNSIEHFRQCVLENRESMSGPDAAIRVLRVLELADADMAKGAETEE